MENKSIREAYGECFKAMLTNSVAAAKIDASNVYQPANKKNKEFIDKLVSDNLDPESYFENLDNFVEFFNQVKAGKSGLLLLEHYSNTDLPEFIYMLEHNSEGKLAEFADKIVAIAGMKLNEANPAVRAFAESFSRVVIYPTRSLTKAEANAQSEEEAKEEEARARKINMAAMRAMDECKKRGQVILVFPSGTRYRPGHPETKRGLKEIDSYLRLFDIALFVSINGSVLQMQPGHEEDMLSDLCVRDKVVFTASPVIECKKYRKEYLETLGPDCEDPKQAMIDHVMEVLDKQHEETEKKRK